MIKKTIESIHNVAKINERIEDLQRENNALWARMVELEISRNDHSGGKNCPGCNVDVQAEIKRYLAELLGIVE